MVRLAIGQRVDPAAWLGIADLDLGSRLPAGAPEPSIDLRVQDGVDQVPLSAAVFEVPVVQLQRRPEPQRGED
jgi:hypothetical protein